jgi:hypothetical protein
MLRSDHFIASTNSIISSSSQKGIWGTVMITSPEGKISNSLATLPTRLLKISRLHPLCNGHSAIGGKPSHFIVTSYKGNPFSPEDWQASYPLDINFASSGKNDYNSVFSKMNILEPLVTCAH